MLSCVNLSERLFQICTHKETDFLHRLKPTDSNGFAVWTWPCVTISSEMLGPGPLSSCTPWDIPGGPVVKTSCSTVEGLGSIPDWGTQIPCPAGYGQKEKKKKSRKEVTFCPCAMEEWAYFFISTERRLLNGSGTCSLGPTCLSTSAPP